jgi:hypothetical protein
MSVAHAGSSHFGIIPKSRALFPDVASLIRATIGRTGASFIDVIRDVCRSFVPIAQYARVTPRNLTNESVFSPKNSKNVHERCADLTKIATVTSATSRRTSWRHRDGNW